MTYLSIGEFARASGLTAKALRLYDELDLLVPAEVDEFNGYRRYAPEQLERARLVASLRLIGMPLYRIREIAGLRPEIGAGEIADYWRQVEADHRSRHGVVLSLVEQLSSKEMQMTSTDQTWSIRSVVRHEQGARSSQQDAAFAGRSMFAIADGFGSGDTAAPAAVEAVAGLDQEDSDGDPTTALEAAVSRAANVAPTGDDGTTLTALWFTGGQAVSAHIGDCRLHRIREGQVERLTRDHTLVAALVEEGKLTEGEASAHPHRALLNRALAATAPGEADIRLSDVSVDDRFALTSDGVHSVVGVGELSSLMLLDAALETIASKIAAAVEEAQAPDNYSLILVEVGA
ncbi:MAG: MerR family transcriptional regulator [Nocardioides sp.]